MKEIVILIIIIILFIGFLFSTSYRIKGGEYFTFFNLTDSKDTKIISPGTKYFLRNKTYGDIKTAIETCAKYVEEFAREVIEDKIYIMHECQGKRLSDSILDLFIFSHFFNINNGFSVCELRSNWFHAVNKNPIKDIGSNIISTVEGKNITLQFKYAVDNIIDMIRRFHKYQIFIEFSYDLQIDTAVAYKNIRIVLQEIIKSIIHIIQTYKSRNYVLFYKYYVSRNGNIETKQYIISKYITSDVATFVCFNEDIRTGKYLKQYVVEVPRTVYGLKMDEMIEFATDEGAYSIQIEDSENLTDHKSNGVEFLLRSFKNINGRVASVPDDVLKLLKCSKHKEIIASKTLTPEKETYIVNHGINVDIIKSFISSLDTSQILFLVLNDMGYSCRNKKFISRTPIHVNSPFYLAYPLFVKNYFNTTEAIATKK